MEALTSALNPFNLKYVYSIINGKKREKLDYILEPLQAMVQISMLAFCPVGSKLTIAENLLGIQLPGMSQGIIRYFNDDTKEDLCYLYNVFRRFISYYNYLRLNTQTKPLYDLLIELSKQGLANLIQTYTASNKGNVIHTLQMYRNVLDKPEFFINGDMGDSTDGKGHGSSKRRPDMSATIVPVGFVDSGSAPGDDGGGHASENIDTIFNKIVRIYSVEEFTIIYNILVLMQRARTSKSPRWIDECQELMAGLNQIMNNTSSKIKKWINENITL
jgi:hypothetical protein